MVKNVICELFGVKYPIVQAGMIWCSDWRLASAVSNAGGLGLIGSGAMYPDILRENIKNCKAATSNPFGVNVPLLYPDIEKHMQVIIEEEVPIVFTSAGNPKTWTNKLKEAGVKVVHVVSNLKFALKAQEAGVDAIVAEGFEAGGHNGREETTTLCLIPYIKDRINIPLIAAGGIADARSMLAVMALGADGVQIGTRFVASEESSAHVNFKQGVLSAIDGSTELTLKELTPVRLLKNKFYTDVRSAIERCDSKEQLLQLLGKGRAKKGMYEGDMEEGELEIGQVAAAVGQIKPAADIVNEIVEEFNSLSSSLAKLKL